MVAAPTRTVGSRSAMRSLARMQRLGRPMSGARAEMVGAVASGNPLLTNVGDARQWRKDRYKDIQAQKTINFGMSRRGPFKSVGEAQIAIRRKLEEERLLPLWIKMDKEPDPAKKDALQKEYDEKMSRIDKQYPVAHPKFLGRRLYRAVARAAERGLSLAKGGSVGGPSGTDTVPAWLSPGEFVVNARATQKNLPLLHSINAQKLANGTPDNGNLLGNIGGFTAAIMTLTTSINALANLSSSMDKLSKLEIPQRIEIGGTYTVEVIHNGLEVLSGLDAKIKQILMENIDKATGINRVTGETSESFGQQQIA